MKDYFESRKNQACRCKFRNFEKEASKYQLVLCVLDDSLRKRYLQDNDLEFDKGIALGIQFETIEIQSSILSNALHTECVCIQPM